MAWRGHPYWPSPIAFTAHVKSRSLIRPLQEAGLVAGVGWGLVALGQRPKRANRGLECTAAPVRSPPTVHGAGAKAYRTFSAMHTHGGRCTGARHASACLAHQPRRRCKTQTSIQSNGATVQPVCNRRAFHLVCSGPSPPPAVLTPGDPWLTQPPLVPMAAVAAAVAPGDSNSNCPTPALTTEGPRPYQQTSTSNRFQPPNSLPTLSNDPTAPIYASPMPTRPPPWPSRAQACPMPAPAAGAAAAAPGG